MMIQPSEKPIEVPLGDILMTKPEVPPINSDSKNEILNYYRQMLLIRRFEEKAGQLYGMGVIGGFCHLYIGQEAVVVGLESVVEDGDKRITGYRDHGHMLACGMDPNGVMCELAGVSEGYSKGKGGSHAYVQPRKEFFWRTRNSWSTGSARRRACLCG